MLFDKKVTQSFELTIETASIRSDPFGPRVNKPVLYGHLQPCNRDLQNARPIFISLAASIAKSINHRLSACLSYLTFGVLDRGVVLKRSGGTPETRLRQRFTVT